MATIKIDVENNAETFWDFVHGAEDAPQELLRIADEIEVSKHRALEIKAWCDAAPGFSQGPNYARDALMFDFD